MGVRVPLSHPNQTKMDAFILTSEEVRSIILNAHKIKKDHVCTSCAGTGFVNWNNVEGNDKKAGKLANYDENREDGYCEDCLGVGYKDVTLYSE